MSILIEIQNLAFWYGQGSEEVPVIKDLNLTVEKGEFVAVVGPNGCGKSTLIRHLNGLLIPRRGTVTVNGLVTAEDRNLPVIRRKVGMVFQNPDNQLFAAIVEEDVAFGLENLCLPREEIRKRVDTALAQVGMAEYKQYPPHRLSGGQKQKVAIAGILAVQPECILLDEPTSMLDPRGKKEVREAVRELNKRLGITVIYVTHDMNEALDCERLVALSGGNIVFDGKPGDFFADRLRLSQIGLQPPPIKELVNNLINEGVNLPGQINSTQELVNVLCR